ncbi:MAG: hypothetical protein B2I17_05825 [Thermoplasmatales archaeon B_DKE]|nr:MAG: hypothetical protein B2I17_05825 [Thermoplasmatales archaeon B_DKE]
MYGINLESEIEQYEGSKNNVSIRNFFYIMQIFVFRELFCITASVQFPGIWTKVPESDEHDEVFCAREDGCVWGW